MEKAYWMRFKEIGIEQDMKKFLYLLYRKNISKDDLMLIFRCLEREFL